MNILEKEKHVEELLKQIDKIKDRTLINEMNRHINDYLNSMKNEMTNWDRVLLARHAKRPTSMNFINAIFSNFIELHGDRLYGDDQAIITGLGTYNNKTFTIIAEQKGKNTKEAIIRNFGMPNPEGYRKSIRLMKLSEKFNRPIITFIDTPGAYPGIGAEERGQGEAIAKSLLEMSKLTVPVIAFIIGEGGSGGALALAVANKVVMLENAIYSILSPEGYASIVWKDAKRASEAADSMKLTSKDLLEFNIIDEIVEEPNFGCHNDLYQTVKNMKKVLDTFIKDYEYMSRRKIREERYSKFRNIGYFQRFNYENL